MKTVLIILTCFFFVTLSFSQSKRIKITNSITQKEHNFKEHKRIRLITEEGKRITGRFTIIDTKTIRIKKHTISLDEIKKIKRHPIALSLFTHSASIVLATGVLFGTAIAAGLGKDPSLLYVNIPIIASTAYHIIKGPNLLKGFKKFKNWEYEIIIE